jgi:hypothetical protein
MRGLIYRDMKDNLQKDQETAMEFGYLITTIRAAIDMKANIKTIEKMDLEFINGKMVRFIKDNF